MGESPYEDHELRYEWAEFKKVNGVTTARMNQVDTDGDFYPCVKVFMRESATDEDVENVYEKADEMGLVRVENQHEEANEHVFISEKHVE